MAATAVQAPCTEKFNIWDTASTTKRTEAVPKNSLFGTTLELHDEDEIKKIDLNTRRSSSEMGRRPREHYILPDFIKNHLQGKDLVIKRTKQDLEKQKKVVAQARKSLEDAEKKARDFGMDTYLGVREGDPTPRMKALISMDAANMVKEMNHVGLNERNSYNRDKYGKKPPTHKYSLIGDVMQPRSMELPRRRERTEVPTKKKEIEEILPMKVTPRRTASQMERERLAVDLPNNIRHQFGSKVCESLLADEKLVNKTMEEQKLQEERARRSRRNDKIPEIDKELNPEYESLGNFMRMNMFPGYNINHKISTTKSTFTDDVHLRRVADPDQWRMQRDDLSEWAEFNILNERMKKRWDEYLNNMPKAEANWNRSAKRQRAEPVVQQKPKTVKKAPAKPKEAEKPAFEEVKFVTPPVTPPPPGGKVQLQSKPTKDEEFWKFYDKGEKG